MVPTSLILDLLIKAMATPSGSEGTRRFLVDGFPRKLDQLQDFEAKVRNPHGVDDMALQKCKPNRGTYLCMGN